MALMIMMVGWGGAFLLKQTQNKGALEAPVRATPVRAALSSSSELGPTVGFPPQAGFENCSGF